MERNIRPFVQGVGLIYDVRSPEPFGRAHAAYLASKIAADLKQLQLFYGEPTGPNIDRFESEMIILLVNRCVSKVTYGFVRANDWVMALRYTVTDNGLFLRDDRSGRIPASADVCGAAWHSFLEYTHTWQRLERGRKEEIVGEVPFMRTNGAVPGDRFGVWESDKNFSTGGMMLKREILSLTYSCNRCDAPVQRNANPCPGCGIRLDWSRVL